jgi:hypothetical protein
MTIELALCIVLMLLAFPVSRSIAAHYLLFASANLALLDVTYADSSFLAILFALLAAMDTILFMAAGRKVLLISSAVSALLCLESIMNMDWLLSHVTYLSVAVNAAIAGVLAKEYLNWTHGKYGRY